jgi:Gluconate 2-dehydrogenase subunit 3
VVSDCGVGARYAAKGVIRFMLSEAQTRLGHLSWKRERELARRRRERPRGSARWLRDDEIELIDVLAALIVPSDETSPGAHEAAVVQALDAMVAASPQLQSVYERGLLALDELARRANGDSFVALTRDRQVQLLNYLDRLWGEISCTESLTRKIMGAALMLRVAANGSLAAAQFFARLVGDVKQAFYTSRVGWEWLGYDGPPMPEGYPDLAVRSARGASAG